MKRLQYLIFFAITLTFFTCTEREDELSLAFGKVSRIEINTETTIFTQADSIQPLSVSVRYFDKDGGEIKFNRVINLEYYFNDEKSDLLSVDRSQKDVLRLQLSLPNKQRVFSNTIELYVLPIEELVEDIELRLDRSSRQFIMFQDTLDFISYLSATVTDSLDNEYEIDLEMTDLDFFVDDLATPTRLVEDFPNGDVDVSIEIGGIRSNDVPISVFDPRVDIQRVELDFADETRNEIAVAGSAIYDFVYRVFDDLDRQVPVDFTTFNVGTRSYDRITGIRMTETGTIEAKINVYGVESNSLFIESRADQVFEDRVLPVIFHVVHNGDALGTQENPSMNSIVQELNNMNDAFRNEYREGLQRSMNAVDSYLQFRMAATDPNGNSLTEPGINRMQISTDVLPNFGGELYSLMFSSMWDPTKYINIFICNVDGNFSFAYFPTFYQAQLAGVGTTFDPNELLTYPYGIMLNNTHFNTHILSHEMGHYLALAHTFVPDSQSPNCYNSDHCEDTQDYINEFVNVDGTYRRGCQSERFYSTNFMDYNNGSQNSFTFDQRHRMRETYDHALFFPREDLQGGRTLRIPFRKGELDESILPVACEFIRDLNGK